MTRSQLRVQVFGYGRFGHLFADTMAETLASAGAVGIRVAEPTADTWPAATLLAADLTLVAFADATPNALVHRFDAAAFGARASWLPVRHRHPAIEIGPVLTPPAGPCLQCLDVRAAQHRRAEVDDAARSRNTRTVTGPIDGLPAVTRSLAAALATTLIEHQVAGRYLRLDTLTGAVTGVRGCAVHGCSRCGDPADTGPGSGDLIAWARARAVSS